MGLPIEKLIVATNSNDILTRFFNTGTMEIRGVQPSISPSMDIQVSSNFERLLFDLNSRDGASTNKILEIFRSEGKFSVPEETLMEARRIFDAVSVSDVDTLGRISATYKEKGEILDPHSAIGVEGLIDLLLARLWKVIYLLYHWHVRIRQSFLMQFRKQLVLVPSSQSI